MMTEEEYAAHRGLQFTDELERAFYLKTVKLDDARNALPKNRPRKKGKHR